MHIRFVFALALSCLAALPAHAGTQTVWAYPWQPVPVADTADVLTPDYVYAGLGSFDFDRPAPRPRSYAVDFRGEYRWGVSLLSALSPSLRGLDSTMQIHPLVGAEVTSRGAFFGHGGLAMDVSFLRHGLFTWSESAGIFTHGDQRDLGSPFEVRSQIELGWRFDNKVRTVAYISHISNGGIDIVNPGAEIIGGYVAIPVTWGTLR